MNTHNRPPLAFSHDEGVWLWATAGRRYIDAPAGIAERVVRPPPPLVINRAGATQPVAAPGALIADFLAEPASTN